MKRDRRVTVIAALLLAVLFAGSVEALRRVETARGREATLEDVLYISSSKTLKRMSLGYSGLLANIYWTRAVQYYGSRVRRTTRFDLLDPLLEITTDLDPHLIVAYQTGAIFLCQKPPMGAGQPDRAVALLEKGIRENPEYWRMYFTLGFVHYLDRKDYKAAQEAFERGSQVPGALPWMKVMAARMAEHAAEYGTAIELWKTVYESNSDKTIRETALKHIQSVEAGAAIDYLERQIQAYKSRTGVLPSHWTELERAGLIKGIPVDPLGYPFKLMTDGTVEPQNSDSFPFLEDFRASK